MSEIVYRIVTLLQQVLAGVPLGTNLGLLHLLFALVSGRFLPARGAVFAALTDGGLDAPAVRRACAALSYGQWNIADLLACWHKAVGKEGRFRPHEYAGLRPVPCDLVAFFRPRLHGCTSKHYTSQAGKALPAFVFGVVGAVGSVGKQRLVQRAQATDTSEADLQKRTLRLAGQQLQAGEALITDAGFPLADLLGCGVPRFVARVAKNATFRRDYVPPAKKTGRPPKWGEIVRPLARLYKEKELPATPPDAVMRWKVGRHTLRAHIFNDLVERDAKPGAMRLRCVVILDPRYHEPLVLVSNLAVSAYVLWQLYRDRWPIEQLPLAAKQMVGAERAFVFGQESRLRLPELALLAGNILSYVAATSQPVASGFWDRCARPTCGRLRRQLSRVRFDDLPCLEGQIRRKNSVTAHLPKGVRAHRRTKTPQSVLAGA